MKKKKNIRIIFDEKVVLKDKEIAIYKVWDSLWYRNFKLNEKSKNKLKNNDLITHSKKLSISDVFFNTKTGEPTVMIETTSELLEALVKSLKKDLVNFKKMTKKRKEKKGICLRHLSPDVTFLVKYKV